MRSISAATSSLSAALLKAADGAHLAAFSFQHQRHSLSLVLRPSQQHPLLPLPDPPTTADDDDAITTNKSASDIQKTFLKSNINKVAFIRHGNTASASVDFDRTLTELGRSQSRVAGASFGIQELYPFYEKAALSSTAPRCVETAELFLDSSLKELEDEPKENNKAPPLKLLSQLYDGTMQPEGSRLFRSIGYATLRQYLENRNECDAEAARCVLGEYARVSLDAIWDVAMDHHLQSEETSNEESKPKANNGCTGKTLLFFAHAIYLPSAALAFATAVGCGSKSIDLILDTDTKEAEGYCVHIDTQSISLLHRPEH